MSLSGEFVREGRDSTACLTVNDLAVAFDTPDGTVHAVNGVSFHVDNGETVGIVGESGSGKSVTILAALGWVPSPGRVTSGSVRFGDLDMLASSSRRLRRVRGKEVALVSQDSLTSFNPVLTIGSQLIEAIRTHDRSCSRSDARTRAIELLASVGVPNPQQRVDEYPHQYSGGMRQRALIAMAMAHRPRLLLADEPTTALDVTIQAQVLDALRLAQRSTGSALVLITHDLGVIAEMADRVLVMYGGRIVEEGDVYSIFKEPSHPYTVGLMNSLPRVEAVAERLLPIPGSPPSMLTLPPGCSFAPRCALGSGRARCVGEQPRVHDVGPGHRSACHYISEVPDLLSGTGAGETPDD